jgi:hypothetical protein
MLTFEVKVGYGPGPAVACGSAAFSVAVSPGMRSPPHARGGRLRFFSSTIVTTSQASHRQACREWGLRPHARTGCPLGIEVPASPFAEQMFGQVRHRDGCSAVVASAGAGPIRGPLVGGVPGRGSGGSPFVFAVIAPARLVVVR